MPKTMALTVLALVVWGCGEQNTSKDESPPTQHVEIKGIAYRSLHGTQILDASGPRTYEVHLVITNTGSRVVVFDRVEAAWMDASGQAIQMQTRPTEADKWELRAGESVDFWHSTDGYTQTLLAKGEPLRYAVTLRLRGNKVTETDIADLPALDELPSIVDPALIEAGVVKSCPKGYSLRFNSVKQP